MRKINWGIIGLGNIVSISVNGDFVGWKEDLTTFSLNILFGFLVLFVVKQLTVPPANQSDGKDLKIF